MTFFEGGSPAQTVSFCLMGCLSIIGCLLYLYCFFFLQPVKSLARKLLALIAITEAICIYGNVLGMVYMNTKSMYDYSDFAGDNYPYNCTPNSTQPQSEQFCVIQAFCSNFFSISSFVYNSGLALFMLHITVFNYPSTLLYQTINTTAFVLPSVVTLLVAYKGYYGFSVCTTGGWCWLRYIDGEEQRLLWQTLAGKFWEMLTEAILVVSYVALRVVLWYKQRQCRHRGTSQEVINTLRAVESLYFRLLMTPVVFFFCYIFGTIRSYVLASDQAPEMSHWILNLLSFLHGFGNNAPGFCNFVLFVLMQKSMREDLLDDFRLKWRNVLGFLGCGESYSRDLLEKTYRSPTMDSDVNQEDSINRQRNTTLPSFDHNRNSHFRGDDTSMDSSGDAHIFQQS